MSHAEHGGGGGGEGADETPIFKDSKKIWNFLGFLTASWIDYILDVNQH